MATTAITTTKRKKPNGYLEKPWSDATIGDHRRMRIELEDRYQTCTNATRRFFRCGRGKWHSRTITRPAYDLPQIHHALASCFGTWRIVREIATNCYWTPQTRSVEVAPATYESFLEDGARLYVLPNGARRVFEIERDEDEITAKLIGPSDQKEDVSREFDQIEACIRGRHYLQNQAIRPSGKLLPTDARLTWDSVSIPHATRELILDNTVRLFERREIFRANGVPLTRGVLLHGPPGTGKTMIGRILAGMGLATFIWMTAGDSCHLRATFSLARRLKPTILFLEDLDFYAADRDDYTSRKESLGEILTQLDGMEDNDGMVVVATTNAIDVIEPALKDRPSRFDIVVKIGLPDWSDRKGILADWLRGRSVPNDLIESIASRTAGLSGAQVKEVGVLTLQKAILRGGVDNAGIALPTDQDVDAAVGQLTGKDRKMIGFASSSETAPAAIDQNK